MKLIHEIIEKSDHDLFTKEAEFSEKDLPMLISEQVDKLSQLDNSIKEAIQAAESANESASIAKDQAAGFGKKKVAIEQLQSASYDLAQAVQSGTMAQKVSFEFQTKLAEISKYLFGLGVSNIASNRFVVRELELKLKGASQQELSELAQQEIVTVVKQLKEQEDLLIKLEKLSKNVGEQDLILQIQSQFNEDVDRRFDEHVKVDLRNDEQWKRQAKEGKRLGELLKDHEAIYKQHSEILEIHAGVNEQHSETLKEYAKVDENLENQIIFQSKHSREQAELLYNHLDKHDKKLIDLHEKDNGMSEEIKNNRELAEVQGEKIKKLTDEIHNLKEQLDAKSSLKMSKVNFGVAILAFILSFVHFFI